MADRRSILILGGTREARELASALVADPGYDVTTSLAGRTEAPERPAGTLRLGGFGGVDGLADYLRQSRTRAVIDATHPFAETISANAAGACRDAGIPSMRLTRPAWEAQPGDRWVEVDSVAEAAARIPELGARVFLTVGRQELAPFAECHGAWFLVRLIDPPTKAPPLADHEVVLDRGPFRAEDETALMRDRGIEVLVSKNSGGGSTYAKIVAARELGLPVVMVRRPILAAADEVHAIENAVALLAAHLA